MQPRAIEFPVLAAVLAALLSWPGHGRAGAFFIQEQSVKGAGRAFAGQSALASDPSAIFFNPANAVGVQGAEISLGGYLLGSGLTLRDRGSEVSSPATAAAGGPARSAGRGAGDPVGLVPITSFYAAAPTWDERLSVGLSVTAPFGLSTEYGDSWFGRYDSTKSKLFSLDLGPTLAYALTPTLSVGAGLSVQYARAELSNALPDPLGPPTPATDGRLDIQGEDWSTGLNLGLLYTPREDVRIGLAYRSGVNHELDGHARFSGLSGPLAASNGRFDGAARLHLPDIALLGVSWQASPRLTLLAQINGFNWSEFEEIRLKLDDGRELVSPQRYRDRANAALGLEYHWRERWTLRAGVQFDPTPVSGGLRSSRTPDGDRTWAALGFTYQLRPGVDLDLAYAHIWVRDTALDRTDGFYEGTPLASTSRIRARTASSIDVLGVQLNYRF